MARATGPLFSFDASGSVGGAITFSKWKGRNYIRRRVIPSNPRSALQVSTRALMKFASQNWAGIAGVDQATWDDLAAADSVSPFNSYVQNNLRRWTQSSAPTQAYPAAEVGTVGTLDAQSATGGVGQVTISEELLAANDNWGLFIHRSTVTGFTPARDNLIGILLAEDADPHLFVDTGLVADTYYYVAIPFTVDGVTGGAFAEINAVVT